MLPIFESILPIFLIVLLGVILKRLPIVDRNVWHGLEEVGFYVLFPALLFLTLYRADFSGLELTEVSIGTFVTLAIMFALMLALWPIMNRSGVSGAAYSTVFQTATRWNGFVALAIANKLFGETGLALTALVMALIIIPINLGNVLMLAWFASPNRDLKQLGWRLLTNPLIISSALGLVFNYFSFPIYAPIEQTVDLVASAALGMGLLMVGAGLRIRDTVRPKPLAILPVFLKLILYPLALTVICWLAGARGDELVILAICGSVPTAMNGYLLARQMGGDATLYATVATLQTAAAFFTIPLVIYAARYFASG
ncbi:AEC family transporter [Nitratireductor sp. XY-223]|uniref:AEC family transporter n=1 Tax=Nitratireductor sp. XY-223 TaxID=2561926 RepID=UPI0010AA086D|nr:AEC family transporter [Nitratireductor sp. XY-223]